MPTMLLTTLAQASSQPAENAMADSVGWQVPYEVVAVVVGLLVTAGLIYLVGRLLD